LAGKDENASAAEGGSQKAPEDEIEALTGILGDLEKKVNRQLVLPIYSVFW
jgi:hypothetical protein